MDITQKVLINFKLTKLNLQKKLYLISILIFFTLFSSFTYANNTWTLVGDLNNPRSYHTATTLNNTQVLVTGGDMDSVLLNSAEIFDLNTSLWTLTGSMNEHRQKHIAILLDDGRVLVTGGSGASADLASTEIFNPVTATWSSAASMTSPRVDALVTKLQDGRVMVSSGTASGVVLNSAEIYDPVTNTWTPTNAMATDATHTNAAVLLQDGRVFIKGDSGYINGPFVDPITPWPVETPTKLPQIFDPANNNWTAASPMNTPKRGGTSIVLKDGSVLIVGGDVFVDDYWGYPSFTCDVPAEIYDPSTDTWTETGTMINKSNASKVSLLSNGKVLAFGPGLDVDWYNCGSNDRRTEIYDPATGTWSVTDSALLRHRDGGATEIFADDRVLTIGGHFMKNIVEVYTLSGPSPDSPSRSQFMHISDLDAENIENGDDTWTSLITTTIVDENNQPVYNAAVSSYSSVYCYTNYLGQCVTEITNSSSNDRVFSVYDVVMSLPLVTYNATANTDPDGDSDGTTIVIQRSGTPPPPPPTVSTVHVGDLDGSSEKKGKRHWLATVTIKILDQDGNPKSNVDISGNWSGGASGTGSCTTSSNGICQVISGRIKNSKSSTTFSVNNVLDPQSDYDSTLNSDPDDDSNGTSISISKP